LYSPTEDLHDEPPVGRYAVEVLQQVRLRVVHVRHGVVYVLVNAHRQLALLCDHRRQLLEDAPRSVSSPFSHALTNIFLALWLGKARYVQTVDSDPAIMVHV
jgi:hypothetical protein